MTKIAFKRLPEIAVEDIAEHMSDPVLTVHMPLLQGAWDERRTADFVAMKEAKWAQDGLGHWAILVDGVYVGWGGFQREGPDWDFGLVLKPSAFGLGMRITALALEFAHGDDRIPSVTFLLPPSRTKLGALKRMGAEFEGELTYDGALFRKYRLGTSSA